MRLQLRLHPLAAMIATLVVAASVLPVLAQAQTDMGTTPAAHGSVAIPQDVLRSRARASLDRASAFVAMAREAPAAATDPASAHRASELAHESAAAFRLASADFAKGGYQKAIGSARRSIGAAQAAISAALVTPPAQTVVVATVVENVSGGDVALDAPADLTPDTHTGARRSLPVSWRRTGCAAPPRELARARRGSIRNRSGAGGQAGMQRRMEQRRHSASCRRCSSRRFSRRVDRPRSRRSPGRLPRIAVVEAAHAARACAALSGQGWAISYDRTRA